MQSNLVTFLNKWYLYIHITYSIIYILIHNPLILYRFLILCHLKGIATSINFIIPISLQHDSVNLWYFDYGLKNSYFNISVQCFLFREEPSITCLYTGLLTAIFSLEVVIGLVAYHTKDKVGPIKGTVKEKWKGV